MYKKVLLATDGSATAQKAVRIGADLARSVGAQILVLHVGDASEGQAVLAQASSDLGDGVATRSVTGDPHSQIVDVAEDEGADLIVVGNKGMQGARRFLGSVPNAVSHNASCNVLVVKTT